MKLTLTTNDGEYLDSIEVTPEDFTEAQSYGLAALALLSDLEPGDVEE